MCFQCVYIFFLAFKPLSAYCRLRTQFECDLLTKVIHLTPPCKALGYWLLYGPETTISKQMFWLNVIPKLTKVCMSSPLHVLETRNWIENIYSNSLPSTQFSLSEYTVANIY